MDTRRALQDESESFGWISIVLHWVTAGIVIAMWFIGRSIAEQSSVAGVVARRDLHVTLGLTTWVLLAGRIVWRIITPHPHVPGQSRRIHRIARSAHYLMLLSLIHI